MEYGFAALDIKADYDSDSDDLLEEFYKPVLERSVVYKRAVGYFSDAVLRACAAELAYFISREGKIRLVVGEFISDEEVQSLNPAQRSEAEQKIIRERLLAVLQRLAVNHAESAVIIGDLISAGIAELKVAVRSNGIYHEKYGIFEAPNGDRIAFRGSANETSPALAGQENHESFSVYRSTDPYVYNMYGQALEEKFEKLWTGQTRLTRIYDLDEETIEGLRTISAEAKRQLNKHTEAPIEALPRISELRDYQRDALKAWQSHRYKGILAMATGTGKTITAVEALRQFRKSVPAGFIIIVVPYQNLAVQWAQALNELGIDTVEAFQTYTSWYTQLQNAFLAASMGATKAPCIVTVADTYKSDRFQELLQLLAQAYERNHLLIADECHHFNSPQQLRFLPDFIRYRLGLSATPYDQYSQRYLDEYFGGIVYEFSLGEAIARGFLCPYQYHPVPAYLNDEELAVYETITHKIVQVLGSEEEITPENLYKVQPLLLQRSRLVGACADKLNALARLINKTGRQPYTLVYCGDGSNEDEEGQQKRQIEQVSHLLYRSGWKVGRVTSDESLAERERLLEALASRSLDAIVSIRVLDEGIDIPVCRTALFLASQRSERQHIQRRGRVLRRAPGKVEAVIYDFVVVGAYTPSPSMKKLVQRELERVVRFANDALNKKEILDEAAQIAMAAGITDWSARNE